MPWNLLPVATIEVPLLPINCSFSPKPSGVQNDKRKGKGEYILGIHVALIVNETKLHF